MVQRLEAISGGRGLHSEAGAAQQGARGTEPLRLFSSCFADQWVIEHLGKLSEARSSGPEHNRECLLCHDEL
jgi:hypothetical protein